MDKKGNRLVTEGLAIALEKIHNDYKRDKQLPSLRHYESEGIISYGYLRKMVEMELLLNIGTSRKTAKYVWNAGESPDYHKLANEIIDFLPKRMKEHKQSNSSVLNQMSNQTLINAVIGLTLELRELGMSEEAIKKRIPDLLAAFSSNK